MSPLEARNGSRSNKHFYHLTKQHCNLCKQDSSLLMEGQALLRWDGIDAGYVSVDSMGGREGGRGGGRGRRGGKGEVTNNCPIRQTFHDLMMI